MQAAFLKALSWFCHSTVRNRARGSVLDVTSSKETAAAVFLFCDYFLLVVVRIWGLLINVSDKQTAVFTQSYTKQKGYTIHQCAVYPRTHTYTPPGGGTLLEL